MAVHRIGDPTGVPVILTHGTFSNATFWLGTRGTGFARLLADSGFEALVLEFRGHGESQRPLHGQRWRFDDWGRLDVAAAIDLVVQSGRRPFIVGHSAGGVSALAALAGDNSLAPHVRGAILIGAPMPWLQRWRKAMAWLMRAVSRRRAYFPARLLRLGPEDELGGVMEQWMDWNVRGHWLGNDGTDYVAALRALDIPILCLAGEADHRFAPPDACFRLMAAIGGVDRRFVLAARDAGYLRDYGHVDIVISREAREEIWPLMTRWLAARRDQPLST